VIAEIINGPLRRCGLACTAREVDEYEILARRAVAAVAAVPLSPQRVGISRARCRTRMRSWRCF